MPSTETDPQALSETQPDPRNLRIAAIAALLVSGGVHVQQYVDGYSALPVVGPLFLVHAAVAVAVSAWLAFGSRTILPSLAGIALEVGALVSLGLAFTGTFFQVAERGLRAGTLITILSEIIAIVMLGFLVAKRYFED